ncbi:MAG: hypothetical protein H7A20_09750 [Rhodanobacteraceae bacterium]|nr:hypothetical protein [Rhodanobacteraceae bacterium]
MSSMKGSGLTDMSGVWKPAGGEIDIVATALVAQLRWHRSSQPRDHVRQRLVQRARALVATDHQRNCNDRHVRQARFWCTIAAIARTGSLPPTRHSGTHPESRKAPVWPASPARAGQARRIVCSARTSSGRLRSQAARPLTCVAAGSSTPLAADGAWITAALSQTAFRATAAAAMVKPLPRSPLMASVPWKCRARHQPVFHARPRFSQTIIRVTARCSALGNGKTKDVGHLRRP